MRTEQEFASAPGAQDRLVIVVADGSFGDGKRLIEHFDDVDLRFGDLSDVGALADLTAGASAVVVTLQPLRAAHIAAFAPSVRVIGRAGVGVDTIDLEAAEAAGITVVNQPGYGTREVASHAVALLLALQRRLCGLDDYVRRGWSGPPVLAPMKPLDELVVGLVGGGRIGRATAEMLKGLVGEILVYDPAGPSLPDGTKAASLKELLGRSDVVSLHLPLTPQTAGMVDAEFLATMAPGALLVNVSRGGLVDEDALVAALDSGHIGGAALDVFPVEPLPQTSPLLRAKNTLFTPHCASYSERSVWRLASWTVADTINWLRSDSIEHGNIVVRGPGDGRRPHLEAREARVLQEEAVVEEIFIPASGMAAEDVLVTEWLKQPGDQVAAGEPVAVVETDKAVVELSGESSGRLSSHLVPTGARVPGGTTIAYLLAEGESEPGAASPASTTPAPAPADAAPAAAAVEDGGPGTKHSLSPRQRRALAEASANGASGANEPAAGTTSRPERHVAQRSSSSNREATAALVSESWRTAPHFSVGKDVRADGLSDAVQAARAGGTQATVTDFLLLALSRGLLDVGEQSDVGLAVATDWGVLIPVLRSLDNASISDVAALRQAAVERARQRRLSSGDTAPVVATLSNLGPAGVTWFNGVVPLNQVALLTVGEVALRPTVENGAIVAAPIFTAVVTADHRRYDGVDSAKLLTAFVEHLAGLTAGALK